MISLLIVFNLIVNDASVFHLKDTCFYINPKGDTTSCKNYSPVNGGKMQIYKGGKLVEESLDYKNGKTKYIAYNTNGTPALVVEGYTFLHTPDSVIFHGKFKKYDRKGILREERNYKDGDLIGACVFYYPSSYMETKIMYKKNEKNGCYVKYYDSTGAIENKGKYDEGRRTGKWKFYHNNSKNSIKAAGNFDKISQVFQNGSDKDFDSLYKVTSELENLGLIEFPTYFFLRTGIWEFFDESGKLFRREEYLGNLKKVLSVKSK
jgi:antitoxin component YwqK of YwqJK toxin-antitoxin module